MSVKIASARLTEERLRWLETVTDAGLAQLTVDRLLDELLDKVRELMAVDTAAVLLLDPSRQFLVATAARGIEEEVHQGVRIPLGRGFAGRIAKERHWVAIDHVDHSNVLNPILREKGIASLLGVPLLAGGAVLGVLHVGTLTPACSPNRTPSCSRWSPTAPPRPPSRACPEPSGPQRRSCNAHCYRPSLPTYPGWSSPPATSPAIAARSAVTGTTSSSFPPARSAWSSATSSGTA